jgi:hypothetical protein
LPRNQPLNHEGDVTALFVFGPEQYFPWRCAHDRRIEVEFMDKDADEFCPVTRLALGGNCVAGG